jgi:predicted ATPase/class 3 adenylate cyclase
LHLQGLAGGWPWADCRTAVGLGKPPAKGHRDRVSDLPTGTVTFLFTDIEGSTRLLAELGPEPYAEALAAHRRVLREVFARHRGVEVGTEGDAFFVAFERASDALAASREGQAALAGGRMGVRMGIHSGEPLVSEGNYVGMDVHRAARIAAAGHGGQVLVSQATRALLDTAIELRDLGEHWLKDLSEPERLFQLGTEEFAPLTSLSNTNLPTPVSSMVGRRSEVEQICDLLGGGRSRLVTLTGPGGTGKTRLAVEAASVLLPRFANGVFFVELAPITDPRLVVSEIAHALGTRERGPRGPEEELIAHLRSRALLLVVDNFEQVLEAAPVLARLLRACSRLAILVTSRSALRLTGEQEFPVPPLELPSSRARSAEELARCESVVLFVERARAVAPGFAITDRTAPEIATICRRLDGIPLAIELAAARTKLLDPRELLARLERSLPLLTGGPRDVPDRQRTLRATIDWSYDLLDRGERGLLARLAVFAGTFGLDAAQDVAEADLETMSTLIDGSLLRPSEGSRFVMLETIREYAQERLEESDASDQLRTRHSAYYLALAERAEAELAGPEQLAWLDLLEADHDNLRAGIAWLGSREPLLRLRLVVALRRFWYVRGHLTEGRRHLEEALAEGEAPPHLRQRAMSAIAATALIQGDYEEATRWAEQVVDVARAAGDPAPLANALSNLGGTVIAAGDVERAAALLEESVVLAQEAGDERVLALALNNLGDVALTAGDYRRAEASFEESLGLLRGRGDAANVARSLFNLGAVAFRLDRREDAREHLRESITICRDLGDKEDLAWCLEGFAAIAAAEGEPERAGLLLGAGEMLLGDMGAALKPFERQLHEETFASVLRSLGDAGLADTLSRGAELTTDDAVDLALADTGALGRTPAGGS